jgi:SAM-dependent methyltransferase
VDHLPIVKGLATFVLPADSRLRARLLRTAPQGGTRSAAYCYGVWLKHLCLLHEQGRVGALGRIAEFGPGESLGVGLAALLSGAADYSAFDAARFAPAGRNLALLDELIELFRRRSPRPRLGWPSYEHLLDADGFPGSILTADRLDSALEPGRLAAIRDALARIEAPQQSGIVRYRAPWDADISADRERYDLIFSQSVLQYIEDLDRFYAACAAWLKPGGWMSHHIDLSSMGMTRQWNGHWSYPPMVWRIVRGRRPFFMTGRTASDHLAPLERHGFRILRAARYVVPGIDRSRLARTRAQMSQDDLECASLFVIARKL